MKSLIVLFLLFGSSSFAVGTGTGNTSNQVSLGGANTSLNDNLTVSEGAQPYFTLSYAVSNTCGTNAFFPFYKNGIAYQVPAGSSFHAIKICRVSNAADGFQLMNSTSAITFNTTSVPTGTIYMTGVNSPSLFMYNTLGTSTYECWDYQYNAAASTYVGAIESDGSVSHSAYVIGRETTP